MKKERERERTVTRVLWKLRFRTEFLGQILPAGFLGEDAETGIKRRARGSRHFPDTVSPFHVTLPEEERKEPHA